MNQIINFILKIILNRNFFLVFAVIMGISFGNYASYIKEYTIYVLAITMVFSTTGIDSKALLPIKKLFKPMLVGTVLNYFVFGAVVLILAWFLMPTKELFMGFVIIVAAPPGVAIIPFSGILKGDIVPERWRHHIASLLIGCALSVFGYCQSARHYSEPPLSLLLSLSLVLHSRSKRTY